MRGMRRWVAIAAAVSALLVAAPTVSAATLRAHAGGVRATVTLKGRPPAPAERLTITRAGKLVYDQPVSSTSCLRLCVAGKGSLRVLDLEPARPRDVVLDLFSGGAHCCTVLQIFSYDAATRGYVEAERNFGDPGVRFLDLRHNGRVELLTADDSFAYEFTSFAA